MVPNAPQWYETHQNVNLGSNGVDRVRSLRKIPTQLHGTNICTSSARFPPSFVRQPNGPECTQMIQNTEKHQFGVQWVGSGSFVAKNSDMTSWHKLFSLIAPLQPSLHQVSCGNETIPNAPKHHEMHQNLSLWSNGVERVRSL